MVVFVMVPLISFARSGCCSWHGGVCGCDTSTGSQLCCDGSDSPSCGCQYIPPKQITTPVKTTKDNTDYKALSASLQSQIDSDKDIMQKMQSSIDAREQAIEEDDAKIKNLQKSVDTRNNWLWVLGIGLFIGICIIFSNEDKHW